MADTRRTHSSRSRAGWVWVIVGIVAVGLIVWWIAAAVDEDEGVYQETGEISVIEETEEGLDEAGQELSELGEETEQELGELGEGGEGDQIFEDQNGIFEEESEQADRSGQVLGEAPGTDEFEATDTQEPQGVQEFSQWNQEQQQAQVNENYVRQGSERLGGAIDGVILMVPEQQLQQGEQVGGGPADGEQDQQQQDQQQQIQSQRDQVGQSLDELQQAEADQQPQAFSQAANNVVNLLSSMAQQANLDQQLNQPIQNLEQSAQQLQPDQPLAQQEQQVRDFFNQAEQVLSQMSQNLQQATGGGPTDGQQQQQYDGMTD